MTTEERLSSAERHIAELQDQTSTMAQGQNAHGAILDRMGEVLERLAFAYVDTSNSLVRIEALVQDQVERLGLMEERLGLMEERLGLIEERLGLMEDRQGRMEERLERIEALAQDHTRTLQAHSVDLSAIRAVLGQDQDEPDP